jgi:curved DNA-binding protein
MEYKDYYKILGVDRDVKPDELKRVYRKLARKYHPDVSKEANAEEKFKEVQEAYEVLKDPEKRKAYDQLGANWKTGQEFRPPPGWETQFDFGGGAAGFTGEQFSDFFESLFGGGFTSRRTTRRGFTPRGEDLRSKISISLEDAFHGTTQTLRLQMPVVDASGRVITKPCTLKVKIPAGIKQGQQIRLAGQGGEGYGGAPRGDLYLEVAIKPHALFKLEGKNVYLAVSITPWEAALGAKVAVPTLAGKVELSVPAGSESGKKLRLRGRGLPGKNKGDQYVTLQIVTPIPKNEQQREFYRKMAETMPFNPRAGENW